MGSYPGSQPGADSGYGERSRDESGRGESGRDESGRGESGRGEYSRGEYSAGEYGGGEYSRDEYSRDLRYDPDEDWRQGGIGGLFGSRLDQAAARHPETAWPGTGTPDGPDWRAAALGSQPQPAPLPGQGPAHARHAGHPDETAALPAEDQPASLTAVLRLPHRPVPPPGWRRVLFRASGGLISVPATSAEIRRQDMLSRVRTPVAAGHHRVAVISLKGGVGKTTVAVGLGSTLAGLRGDRVIAVDANPERGTLADKLPQRSSATVRDLLAERAQVRRYADVRKFTAQAASRLEVLASTQDPAVSETFGEQDYRDTCAVLERYYSVCITDCGAGLMHSAMAGVLALADQIVLVTSGSVDGARTASACLDWLAAHGHDDLARNAIVVVNAIRRWGPNSVDLNLMVSHFAARCRVVTWVPYDPYLARGAEIEIDQLRKATDTAFLALAAAVGDGFARRQTEPVG